MTAGFELALVIAAILAWGRLLGALGPPRSLFRVAVESVAVHVVVSTLLSVALWSAGGFRVVTAQALAAAVPLALLLRSHRAPWPEFRSVPLITRYELITLVLLVLVAPVALPRMQPLYMENDAGVYSNRAIHHLYSGSLTGAIPVRDRLGGELLEVFDRDNLVQGVPLRGEGGRIWSYLPGTYLTAPGANEFRFQFYPGWPLLMAQWGGIFGLPCMFYAVFSSFSLAVLLFAGLLEDRGLGLTAFATTVALFTSSPLLLYFSKYTTTEAFLLFLFLFIIYFFSLGTVVGATLAVAALAATVVSHISTFLYAPLVLLLGLEGYRSADRRVASFAAASFVTLLGGMALGVHFSPDYFLDIFHVSFIRLYAGDPVRWGLASVAVMYGAGLALSIGALWRAGRAAKGNDGTPRWPDCSGRLMLGALRALMVVMLGWTIYQAYLLGWTDHFLPDTPGAGAWGHRVRYAGGGWGALAHLNIVSMVMGTSLVGLPLVVGLTLWRGERVLAAKHRCFLLAGALLSLGIYTFFRIDTPHNYYASRYFIPVFVPSAMLLFGELLDVFRVRRRWILALAVVGLGFNLTFDRALYVYESFTDELRFIEDVAARVGDNRVLFVRNHRRDNRLAQRLLALPLAYAHNISLVNVVNRPDAPVDRVIADYAHHLKLRDAAVLSRRPPTDGHPFEAVYLMRWYLRRSILYPYRPSARRERYYLYNLAFEG